MRDELERLADRLADIHISDHRPGLWEKMADVEEKLRALAARLPTEKEAMQIDAGGPEQDTPVAPPPSTSGGGDQVPELHVACWEIRWPSTPEGFEEIKYHGTNSVQDYRDHVHPEARSRELVYKDEAIAYAAARVSAETSALRAELDALKLKTRYRMGVGDGAGQLFVYGDYDSIKAAQRTVLRAETAERERDEARAIVDACAKVIRETGRHTRGAHETPHDLAGLIEVMRRDLDEARAEAERMRAFRDFFRDRGEALFFNFGMEAVDLYNACGQLGRPILAETEKMRKDAERFVWQVSEWLKPQSENHRRILDAYRTGDIDAVRSAIDAAILADRGGKS